MALAHDSLGENRTREFINNWIATELLYQEAKRRGLENNDEARHKLEAVRRQFAINALLEEEVFAQDTSAVSDEAVEALFDSVKSAFLLKEDVVNMSYALFSERDAANAFRAKLLRSMQWNEAIASTQADSLLRQTVLRIATRQYFTHSNLYPEELWKLSRTLAKGEVSFVLKTDAGYHVLVVHGMQRTGEVPDLAYVKNEIRDRIMIAERRERYEKLLATLRAGHSVEIHMGRADSLVPSVE